METKILRERKLLILEDEFETCQLLKAFFAGICPVDIAHTPEEAFSYVNENVYDLGIFDIRLEHDTLDGIDVLSRVRVIKAYEDFPALAATGCTMPGDREALLAAGFDGYLAKPFTRDELFQSILQLLSKPGPEIHQNGSSPSDGSAFR